MLRKRNQAADSTTETSDDQSEEDSDGISYGLDGYGVSDADAAEDEDTYDEDGEYDEDYDEDEDGSYDEDADDEDYDDDGEDEDAQYDENEYDEEDDDEEEFTPPSAAAAVKRSWTSSRTKAQPATGTEEDAKKVNFIDKRERMIGYFLGGMLVVLAVVSYFADRRYVDKADLKLQHQIHAEAPWILAITLGLAVLILVATYFKRRAAVGFTLLLAGVAIFNSDFFIGIIYLGTGFWLIFRSMKRSPRNAAAAAANRSSGRAPARGSTNGRATTNGRVSTGATSTRSTRSTSSATGSTTSKSTPGRTIGRNGRLASGGAPGRYTPPKPQRHAPPTVQPEPEPTNRLSAWLKK